jgi:hypothetical protein
MSLNLQNAQIRKTIWDPIWGLGGLEVKEHISQRIRENQRIAPEETFLNEHQSQKTKKGRMKY